ncbi:uncharacterized protein LOC141618749 [Silene latifolia]|uniref:uncharacterized protein LOC141618749 n=1 Tax=Silene latifolia TaxID=37657 RepID=UPI003D77F7E7
MTMNPDIARKKSNFKYFNMWGKDPGFLKIIQEVWGSPLYGFKMFQVAKKLKMLKKPLKELNSEAYAGIETSTKVALLHLYSVQGQLHLDPTNIGLQQLVKEASDLYRDREDALRSFMSQKAKVLWLSEGDDNTHYFHSAIKARRMQNRILGIYDMEAVTEKEIKDALYSIPANKAPRPDGFSSQFFRDSFDITGTDIIGAVQELFSSGKMLKQINSTTITLIPKKTRPNTVADFRPIACCNVVYKIISNVICTRLATVLPDIISETRSAFLKGWDIVDNILICHDLVRLYKRKACSPRCMMKVDLKKAYDSIEWEFIKQMLKALKFPDQMVHWIMGCVTTPWYTLSLNGSNFGYFQGRRGIRQGEPMSPLLFTICMEYLSRIMGFVTNTMEFTYYPLCRALRLNHLCFADDLLMFCGVTKHLLLLFFEHLPPSLQHQGCDDVQYVLSVSGSKRAAFLSRYLGIPISYKRMAVGDCSRLVEKIVLRIRGWGARKLSYAGRLVLVQAVLSQLHSFWTRIFIIPATVMDRINHICRNYLWCGSDEFHKTPPVAGDRVCTAKKYGGLGIVNGKNWNMAMLGKYVWWLAEKTYHLWIRWVNHMYIKGQNWLDYSPTVSSSWTWRKICQVKDILKPGYCQGKWSTNAGVYTVSVGLNLHKHSIIGWLAIQCRLLTKDRLLRFNIISDGYCDMCLDHLEDHNHLLYRCRFSACCWRLLADWLDITLPDTDILNCYGRRWFFQCRGKRYEGKSDSHGSTYNYGVADAKLEVVSGEVVSSFTNDQYLVRDDILSLLPNVHVNSNMIECWSLILNHIEHTEKCETNLMFFRIRHMEVKTDGNGDREMNKEKVFGEWDEFIRRNTVPCNMEADLVFIPMVWKEHYFYVCINFKTETVEVVDNTEYDDWEQTEIYKVADLEAKHMSDYLEKKNAERADDIITFDTVNINFP